MTPQVRGNVVHTALDRAILTDTATTPTLDFFPNQGNRIIIHDITLTFQEMKYEELKMLPPEDFRRFCGVKPETFAAMLLALQEDYQKKHRRGGREAHISLEDKLLITMTYYREYRTQFHIAAEFGTTESNVCKIIRQVEEVLVRHPQFALPGKKALLQSSEETEVVMIDATEIMVERPKKSKNAVIPAKRSDTH